MVGRRRILGLVGLCLVLAGCTPRPAEVDADRMGRAVIDAIQRDDWPVIDKNLSLAMAADPEHAPKIAKLRTLFPPEPPWSIKLLASSQVKATTPERSTLKYLYTFAERKLVIDLTLEHYGWRKVYKPTTARAEALALETEGDVLFEEPPKPKADERAYRVLELYKLSAIAIMPASAPKT